MTLLAACPWCQFTEDNLLPHKMYTSSWTSCTIFWHLNLYILNVISCQHIPMSVMLGVASSTANDVIMRIAGLVVGCDCRRRESLEWRHNDNSWLSRWW